MHYHIFIDESGEFDEAIVEPDGKKRTRSSVVGGVCGCLSEQDWETEFKALTKKYRDESGIPFVYPRHFHCAELFSNKIPIRETVSKVDCGKFATEIQSLVADNSLFLFASQNLSGSFEYSPQATYVLNLITSLRAVMDTLALKDDTVESCHITIAQRTIEETSQSHYDDYTGMLIKYAKTQLCAGDSAGAQLVRKLDGVGTLHVRSAVTISWDGTRANGGLTAADFACGAIRYGTKAKIKPERYTPTSTIGGEFANFYEQQVKQLIEGKQYAAASEFLRRYVPRTDGKPDMKPVLNALQKETDHDVLHRELNALLTEAEYLVEKRTVIAGSLKDATLLLEKLVTISKAHLEKETSPDVCRQWSDLQAHALALLLSCYNHTGAIDPQKRVESELNALLSAHRPKMSLSYLQRAELLLEVKIRNLNLLFNDYRFAGVLEAIETDLAQREKNLPEGETDELLGKMQGSVGQACAFQARLDPSWAEMAEDYFTRSLEHFQSGTLFSSMSINYLATLLWQNGDNEGALQAMNRHPGYPDMPTKKALVSTLPDLLCLDNMSAFDAVNYLRIASSSAEDGSLPSGQGLTQIRDNWIKRATHDHPHEQFAKWLGYLFFLSGMHKDAANMYERGEAICEGQDFTLKTIGLSILVLNAINSLAGEDSAVSAKKLKDVERSARELEEKSVSFATYLLHCGGAQGLTELCQSQDKKQVAELARLLPFSYA